MTDTLLFLRSLLFLIGMVLSTVVIGSIVLLSFMLPFSVRYKITQLWTRFNILSLRFLCGVDYRINGVEHIPDSPVVVLAKHQSTWETLFLQYYLPPLAWVLKRELLKIPIFGWCLALIEPIAINRGSSKQAARQIMEQGTAFLNRGRWVLLFPEGTRTAPGQRQRYRLGGARLAVYSGYPVLPVAHNAGEFWPRRGFIKRPGTVEVVFGEPIDSKDKTPEQLNEQVEQWIETTVDRISTRSK